MKTLPYVYDKDLEYYENDALYEIYDLFSEEFEDLDIPQGLPLFNGKKVIKVSVSQFKDFDLCNLKWYFSKVAKVGRKPFLAGTFGSILHSVLERWLESDGKSKVDLYPEDWEYERDFDDEITGEPLTPADQRIVKTLVAKGIEQGIVSREPGREIEKEINYVLYEDDEQVVVLHGYIDMYLPDTIIDHKTSKNSRYLKITKPTSERYLGKDTQMLIYAYVCYLEGLPKDRKVRLKHNQFIKDPSNLKVQDTEVEVSYETCKQEWDRCVELCKEIIAHKKLQKYTDVSVKCSKNACSAFGGCDYRTICNKQETLFQCTKRLEEANKLANQKHEIKGTNNMSKFKNKLGRLKAGSAQNRAKDMIKDNPVVKETPETESDSEAIYMDAAPWAVEGCNTCKKSSAVAGFNEKGTACTLCKIKTSKADPDKAPKHYNIDSDDSGQIKVTDSRDGQIYIIGEAPEVKTDSKVELKETYETSEGEIVPDEFFKTFFEGDDPDVDVLEMVIEELNEQGCEFELEAVIAEYTEELPDEVMEEDEEPEVEEEEEDQPTITVGMRVEWTDSKGLKKGTVSKIVSPTAVMVQKDGASKGTRKKLSDLSPITEEEVIEEVKEIEEVKTTESQEIPKKEKVEKSTPSGEFFGLCIGAAPTVCKASSGFKLGTFVKHFEKVKEDVAKELGQDNYYACNHFDRRSKMAQYAAEIAESMRGHLIVVDSVDVESRELVNALKVHADLVITGLIH